jgi:hypothetical protein
MGKGIWSRIYGDATHKKVAAAEKKVSSAPDPNAPKPKPKKKKSVESSVRDSFWGEG